MTRFYGEGEFKECENQDCEKVAYIILDDNKKYCVECALIDSVIKYEGEMRND